jgi:hypothetical protein
MEENATYVSVWDGGIEIRTNCKYNRVSGVVYDIETADVKGLDILEDEYVELSDGTKINDFIDEFDEDFLDNQNSMNP